MNKLRQMIDNSTNIELVNYLEKLPDSDRYIVIRDYVDDHRIRCIKELEDGKIYQQFQVLKGEATKSWQHDHTTATMMDVDKALTKVYGILLRMLKTSNDDTDKILNNIQDAINRIEEKIGLDKSKFIEKFNIEIVREQNESTDEQREQENI